ncbi:hypothetical protein D4764_17G0001690 [Takifugu flavidus]|uniref:Uncharacterized protein n=1 Tax=Takifugu flavidus TaxID=433684 RepID=A0A5C6NUL7_9TELE|nr:hypothetical protein D4764_17G0001690 [Takifugu flavidus]
MREEKGGVSRRCCESGQTIVHGRAVDRSCCSFGQAQSSVLFQSCSPPFMLVCSRLQVFLVFPVPGEKIQESSTMPGLMGAPCGSRTVTLKQSGRRWLTPGGGTEPDPTDAFPDLPLSPGEFSGLRQTFFASRC